MIQAEVKTYFGGKGSDGTYQTIINQIPKHELFIETCAGLARITEHLGVNNSITILNDVSSQILEVLRQKFNDRLIETNSPLVLRFNTLKISPSLYGKIIIENMDVIDLLEKYKPLINSLETVIFCNPPYPLTSRKSEKKVYAFEMSDSQHKTLLQYLNKMRCDIIVCTYPNEMYNQNLADWRKIEYWSQTRKGLALENIFLNFDTTRLLQNTRFYGKDFREREKWKKIKTNIVKKINSLPEPIKQELKELLK